jgi:DNA-binding MarR family transcriptional regulator
MEKIGLVTRERGPGGPRDARAALTAAGRERVEDAERSLARAAMRVVGERLAHADALALADLLGRLAPDAPGDLAAGA